MPFVRIDLVKGKPAQYCRSIGEVVYEAMVATLNVPPNDRFQVITQHPAEEIIADETFLGIQRTADCVLIQVTLRGGRTLDQKKAFYKSIADGLHDKIGLRREDVMISLMENTKDDWSFGNGLATYAT